MSEHASFQQSVCNTQAGLAGKFPFPVPSTPLPDKRKIKDVHDD